MNKVLSGIRPTGKLHIGNYLGAIKNWIDLQTNSDSCIFMIADYHGITTPFKPEQYKESVFSVACEYLAAGLDPEKTILIRQSQIPQHTELAWIFNTITPVSWLNRMPTYQEKLQTNPKYNHMGLLDYPVLMAADILIYKANLVPVGEDQLPHIDLANEVAKKFNSMFGQTFEPVKPFTKKAGARIMSLQDPNKKMSKTGDESIDLVDSEDEIRNKIKRAVTDSGNEVVFDEKKKPAISNLISIYHLLSDKPVKEIEKIYEGKGYGDFKKDLAEIIIEFLKPFQEKYFRFSENPKLVYQALENGEARAKEIAEKTLIEVKGKMGLL